MTRNRSQARITGEQARKNIIDTARQFFSEYGYLGASMSDIAARLNVTKAALYYHFAGKAEIFKNVLDEAFTELSRSLTEAKSKKAPDKKVEYLIKAYLKFGAREKSLTKALVFKLAPHDEKITGHIAALRGQLINLIQPVIEEVLKSKKIVKKIDSRTYASLLTGMMDGLLLEYSLFKRKVNPDEISGAIMAALF
ncbi:MAG: TetR/AcrR family transcriptional regulator [Acidobacteriota bacterium]|nr:TetR/AcrR family transcriptional regulator [Acidobacteriota bacterium]